MMKFFCGFYIYLLVRLVVSAQFEAGDRFDENLPDPVLASEEWQKVQPGEVYQGYLKLSTAWQNNWPMSWQLRGESIELKKLPENWFKKNYYHGSEESGIHDPQSYLSKIEKDELEGILRNHEKVSQLPISLLIMGSGENLSDVEVKGLGENFLKKPNTTLMVYYMNEPKATTGYVKTLAPAKIPGNEEEAKPLLDPFLVKTMFTKAGIHAAGMNQESSETLYATVAEVSRRMYWIEQELGLVIPTEVEGVEVTVEVNEVEDEGSVVDKLWEQLGGNEQNLLYLGSGVVVAVLLTFVALGLMFYCRIKSYEFPSYTGSTRLKAKYGAGVSEVVAFKDARVSLSDQKRQIEDGEL